MDPLNIILNVVFYGLLGVEVFINAPMKKIYKLPEDWDNTRILNFGLFFSLFFAALMTGIFPFPNFLIFVIIFVYFFNDFTKNIDFKTYRKQYIDNIKNRVNIYLPNQFKFNIIRTNTICNCGLSNCVKFASLVRVIY